MLNTENNINLFLLTMAYSIIFSIKLVSNDNAYGKEQSIHWSLSS